MAGGPRRGGWPWRLIRSGLPCTSRWGDYVWLGGVPPFVISPCGGRIRWESPHHRNRSWYVGAGVLKRLHLNSDVVTKTVPQRTLLIICARQSVGTTFPTNIKTSHSVCFFHAMSFLTLCFHFQRRSRWYRTHRPWPRRSCRHLRWQGFRLQNFVGWSSAVRATVALWFFGDPCKSSC